MVAPRPVAPGAPFRAAAGLEVFDLAEHVHVRKRWPKTRGVRRWDPTSPSVRRNPADVSTVVLHQTAVEMPPSAGLVKRYGAECGAAYRAARTAYHVLAGPFGVCVAKPLDVYANHAGVLNRFSVGFAVVGRFPGLRDDPATKPREDIRTLWRWKESPATVLTPELIVAAREGLALMVQQGRQMGMPLTRILAHRQGSAGRRADPGEALWQALVVEFATPYLGLEVVPDETWKDGRPLPAAWDPRASAPY